MEEASQEIVIKAIEKFKNKYGIQEPLDLFRFEEIVRELKAEATTSKRRKK
jgi:hypothetical protein